MIDYSSYYVINIIYIFFMNNIEIFFNIYRLKEAVDS